jgi:hypothetical protein
MTLDAIVASGKTLKAIYVTHGEIDALVGSKARRKCENEALAIAATLVGGMILARAVDDRELSDRILAACRARLNRT